MPMSWRGGGKSIKFNWRGTGQMSEGAADSIGFQKLREKREKNVWKHFLVQAGRVI